MKTKHEVLQAHLQEWLATKPYSRERRALKNQLAKTTRIHPRSIQRSMRRLQLKRELDTLKERLRKKLEK